MPFCRSPEPRILFALALILACIGLPRFFVSGAFAFDWAGCILIGFALLAVIGAVLFIRAWNRP